MTRIKDTEIRNQRAQVEKEEQRIEDELHKASSTKIELLKSL